MWISFSIGIVVILEINLSLFGRSDHKVSRKAALIESGLWVTVTLIFTTWFWMTYGQELGVEFLTGYLVEKSLSIDNLFIILLIFKSFQIPDKYQHRVLFFGLLGAVILRTFFIILVAQILNAFHWVLYIFGFI